MTPMDDQVLKRLLEIARKATPGPYRICPSPDGEPYEMLGMFNGTLPDKIMDCRWGSLTKRGQADYAFWQAHDPQTIISLIEEVLKYRQSLSGERVS